MKVEIVRLEPNVVKSSKRIFSEFKRKYVVTFIMKILVDSVSKIEILTASSH